MKQGTTECFNFGINSIFLQLTWKDFKKAVNVGIFNFFIIGIPLQHLMYYAYKWRGNDNGPVLPSLSTAVVHLLGCVATEEVLFYYSHRFCTKMCQNVTVQIYV